VQVLFLMMQYLLPQHCISRIVGHLANCKISWVKQYLINLFIKRYQVNLSEAKITNAEDFSCFNDFFTRELQNNARLIDSDPNIVVSPADGTISQIGDITNDSIIQAKGKYFQLTDLLAGNTQLSDKFINGKFANIYLSPADYHRVHMPITGTLQQMIYVPGKLFSVNNTTAQNVSNLFARNERLICIFETKAGTMAVILVGAMIVAGIETVWSGQVTPITNYPLTFNYVGNSHITLDKGAELGRFKLGSTVILLLSKDKINWRSELIQQNKIQMGQNLGTLIS